MAVGHASAVSLVASSHAVTLATTRSPPSGLGASISAAINEMRAPGRSTHDRSRSRVTGMAPRMSRGQPSDAQTGIARALFDEPGALFDELCHQRERR